MNNRKLSALVAASLLTLCAQNFASASDFRPMDEKSLDNLPEGTQVSLHIKGRIQSSKEANTGFGEPFVSIDSVDGVACYLVLPSTSEPKKADQGREIEIDVTGTLNSSVVCDQGSGAPCKLNGDYEINGNSDLDDHSLRGAYVVCTPDYFNKATIGIFKDLVKNTGGTLTIPQPLSQ